jgi:PAS domain S-box-containing protein/diguanylate cyclase (GGDEF)-like protein
MSTTRHVNLSIGDLLDILPDGIVMVDGYGHISFVNPALGTLLGYTPLEVLGKPLSMLLPPEYRKAHEAQIARYRRDGVPKMMGSRPVLHAQHRNGRLVPVSISLCNLTLDDGERVSVAVIHDVSTMNTRLDRATAHAETDPLTGVGNRLRLSRRMQALLGGTAPFSLLYVKPRDMQRFDQQHGEEARTEAVRIVARRLQSQVRAADVLVHLGDDEFVMLLGGLYNAQYLNSRATSVAESIGRRLHIGPLIDTLGVVIGGAMSPRHGRTERELLELARQAMLEARQADEVFRLAP